MQRRRFLQQSIAASAGTLFSSSLLANKTVAMPQPKADKPFQLNYGIHDGMFQNSAGANFLDQIKYAHGIGFRAIEDNGMMGRPEAEQKKIGDLLASLGMQMGVFVLDKGGNGANTLAAGKQEYIDIFLKGCRRSIEVAK